jgi:hypothetical protein
MNTKKTDPVFVSYQAGCGGDLIVDCLNNRSINLSNQGIVLNPSNLKIFGKQDNFGCHENMQSLLLSAAKSDYRYLSVHDFDILLGSQQDWWSLETHDPILQDVFIYRHLSVKPLRITPNPVSNWFRIVSKLCKNGKFNTAAEYWLKMYQTVWKQHMAHRLANQSQVPKKLMLDHLFDKSFVTILWRNFPHIDLAIATANHASWLVINDIARWNLSDVIVTLENKLKSMDFESNDHVICSLW